MKRVSYLVVPLALFLTGCATDMSRVERLESRLDALETKCGMTEEKPTATTEGSSAAGDIQASAAATEITAPDSPTKKDIQAALANAGFYQGSVDGKFGPKTKKSIEDFQAAQDLKVDGKVGPNTWDKLKKYYVPTETDVTQTKQ